MSHHPDIAFASNVIFDIFDHPLWSIATYCDPCSQERDIRVADLIKELLRDFCARCASARFATTLFFYRPMYRICPPVKSLDLWDCEDIQKYRSEHRALKDQVFASITLDTLEG